MEHLGIGQDVNDSVVAVQSVVALKMIYTF
jgi:hypothetical protein